jgi:hypothetical protein
VRRGGRRRRWRARLHNVVPLARAGRVAAAALDDGLGLGGLVLALGPARARRHRPHRLRLHAWHPGQVGNGHLRARAAASTAAPRAHGGAPALLALLRRARAWRSRPLCARRCPALGRAPRRNAPGAPLPQQVRCSASGPSRPATPCQAAVLGASAAGKVHSCAVLRGSRLQHVRAVARYAGGAWGQILQLRLRGRVRFSAGFQAW